MQRAIGIGGTKSFVVAAVIAMLAMFVAPESVRADAKDDAKAQGQFEDILQAINDHNFEPVKRAIDKNDLTERIYGIRLVEVEVKKIFNQNFWEIVEGTFMDAMPNANSRIEGELIGFAFKDGKGTAAVRYALPKYAFAYQVFDLRHDSRARMKVVDWSDSRMGQTFTAEIGEQLVKVMPSKAATRKLLAINNPSELQLFQVTEIIKATRDREAERFFEIYDDLEDVLKKEQLIAKFAAAFAFKLQDADRFQKALEIFVELYANDPNYSLVMTDFFFALQDYEGAYRSLERFNNTFGVTEGATPARLSALALALKRIEDAEKYGVEATTAEPTLELAWWSLLRARAAAEDYAGATEALTHLEDDFGHKLDAAKLKRDRFKAFLSLADSQEFKDWRAGRQ